MTLLPSPQSLTEARLQLHYAIQPLAATGAALAAPQADDSQSSLSWDSASNCFVGNLIQADQPFQVVLEPINLVLRVLNHSTNAIAEFPLPGQTLQQAMDWLKEAIAPFGAAPNPIQLLIYPPDDFPDHPIAHGAAFEPAGAEERASLVSYYAISQSLLQDISKSTGASPVRIWPHHFDIATLITQAVEDQSPNTIGVGLSPGDTSYPEPYWYVSPYPYPDTATLPDLNGLGAWHTQHWVGAVFTASALNQDVSTSQSIEKVRQFLNRAIEVLRIADGDDAIG